MKALPKAFLDSLQGIEGFNKEAFEDVHAKGEKVTSIRINPAKWKFGIDQGTIFLNDYLSLDQQIPWTEFGYYLNTRPSFTFDPVFHAGSYYVQEASSMFIEQAFKQLINLKTSLKVLDISAAPGGKSTHIQSLISNESLLVCNEVIRGRSNILRDNIIKWGLSLIHI